MVRGYEEKDVLGGCVLAQGPPKRITEQGGHKEAVELSMRRAEGQSEKAIGEVQPVTLSPPQP